MIDNGEVGFGLPFSHIMRSAVRGEPPFPVLVLFHGLGSDETDLLSLIPELTCSMHVISLRGPFSHGSGYSWVDVDGTHGVEPDMGYSLDAVGLVLRQLNAMPDVDRDRIFVAGFSQGGGMAAGSALTFPSLVAGSLVFSGFFPDEVRSRFMMTEAHQAAFFIGHGTLDRSVPVEYGRRLCGELNCINADVTYREYPITHTINRAEVSDAADWLSLRLAPLAV